MVVKKQKSMTQSQFFTELAKRLEIKKTEAREYIETLVGMVYEEAPKAGLLIPGLGKLLVVHRKKRMARNPMTGEAIKVPARKALKFRINSKAKNTLAPRKKK